MNLNFRLGIFISIINVASKTHIVHLEIAYGNLYLRLLSIFFNFGIIRGFRIKKDKISVYFKYRKGLPIFTSLQLISKPGLRKTWTLAALENYIDYHPISGFFILSTTEGIITDFECRSIYKIGGEVLFLIRF